MRRSHLRWLCAALFLCLTTTAAQAQEPFDPDTTLRAAHAAERARLEREIGLIASGRESVFRGELKVLQRDRNTFSVSEGSALGVLSPGSPQTLTLLFPEAREWLRLTQDRATPDVTVVTRLRTLNSSVGVTATCTDCVAPFATLKERPVFLRLAAKGALLDAEQTRFEVEITGYLDPVAPEDLPFDQLQLLRPDFEAWLERPKETFQVRGRVAVRNISALLRRRAPPPGGDTVRFTCNYETRYTAQHFVNLNDLNRYGVRNVALGDTDFCCVDHALHDATRICSRENSQ